MIKDIRLGTGFDVHAFAENRKLVLGGVEIPYESGLAGHSDADVLTHAVMDALLGAAALGDIRQYFPDTNPSYRGASSIVLLKKVGEIIYQWGYTVSNIDVTLIMQRPWIGPFKDDIRKNIAAALDIGYERVNVKATTTEMLGFTGRGEGVAAQAVCLILKRKSSND